MRCQIQTTCSGCTHLDTPLASQQDLKVKNLTQLLKPLKQSLNVSLVSLGEGGFREKGEIVLENQTWGFINSQNKSLVPLNECPQWTEKLNQYFNEIKNSNLSISGRGSARIRTQGNNSGIWLDFANVEIKKLLDESTQLEKLLALGFVEIGQKRKRLSTVNGKLKLVDPVFDHWSSTFANITEFKLYHSIGDFSQTGSKATQKMGEWIFENISDADSILEFGSGIGTLTLPALTKANSVLSLEFNELSTKSLDFTLSHFYPELKSKWQFQIGNFQKSHDVQWQKFNTLIINPPRSGVGDFLNSLTTHQTTKPKKVLYMSCFAESFVKDSIELKKLNYKISDIKILDQFPQTEHYEILSVWQLDSI